MSHFKAVPMRTASTAALNAKQSSKTQLQNHFTVSNAVKVKVARGKDKNGNNIISERGAMATCKLENCGRRTSHFCFQCGVAFCIDYRDSTTCFAKYHEYT